MFETSAGCGMEAKEPAAAAGASDDDDDDVRDDQAALRACEQLSVFSLVTTFA